MLKSFAYIADPRIFLSFHLVSFPSLYIHQSYKYNFKMSFFGVELNAQVNRLILEIRLTLTKNKYLPNFRTIYQSLAKYDPDQSGWVSPANFEKALNQNGVFFKKFEWQVFEKAFLHQGTINWFAFISLLREPLNAVRAQTLDRVWQHLDSTKSGQIHYTILSDKFNASDFKQFKLGHKSKDVILKQFLNLVPITSQGYITQSEFINFYTDLSINIPSDQTFSDFVSAQWGAELQKIPTATVEEVKSALKTIRFKLLQKTNGTHEEFILRKIFNEFDVARRGKLNEEDLNAMLIKLQIPTQRRLLAPLVGKLSHQQDGFIDFADFEQFLFYDPFHI